MATIETWKVDGMTCGGCSGSVERVLQGAPGLVSVKADHVADEVALEIDPQRVDRDEIKRRIEGAGFDVVV
jgi:copper chaperone